MEPVNLFAVAAARDNRRVTGLTSSWINIIHFLSLESRLDAHNKMRNKRAQ